MGIYDTVRCEYRLPNPRHQHLEFQTKDLECLMEAYTISADGRLVQHARREGSGPERDLERPFHGDVVIYARDPEKDSGLVEYVVRFTHGRVEWVRPIGERGQQPSACPDEAPTSVADGVPPIPAVWGRPLRLEDLAEAPEKIELVRGEIPGAEELLRLILTQLGLRRAARLTGLDHWRAALADDDPTETA